MVIANVILLLVIILERSYVTATAFPISLTSVTKDRHDLRDILIKNVCISWKDKLSKSFGAQCVNTKHPQQNIKSAMTSLYKTTLTILHLYSCLNSTTCPDMSRKCSSEMSKNYLFVKDPLLNDTMVSAILLYKLKSVKLAAGERGRWDAALSAK